MQLKIQRNILETYILYPLINRINRLTGLSSSWI